MFKKINSYKLSENLFFIGIFLLPSTLSIGIIFILIASIFTLFLKEYEFKIDRWSKILIANGVLMTISCLYQTFNYSGKDLYGWDISLTWIGLLNWIPFFYIFISTKHFLRAHNQRLKVAKLLFSGSIPVLITGLGQYYLNWEGPFLFSNGIIIWYMKEIEPHLGLSGIFSNQNYAGTWLATIWPFSLGFIFLNKHNKYKQIASIVLLSTTTLSIILTTSRNALLGILISIPIMIGLKSLFVLIFILIILILIFIFRSYFPFAQEFLSLIISLFPDQLIDKFNKIGFIKILEFRRINLWANSFNLISKKPIFGLGAAFFPVLYKIYYQPTNYTEQHTHNLFLELAASYGFIVSLIMLGFISSLIFLGLKSINKKQVDYHEKIVSQSWIAATIVIVLSQMNDITYYDGRISIIFWILLAGVKNMI